MNTFQEYLISEYKVNDYAAVEFKYSHSFNIKNDKKTDVNIKQHNIHVNIKFYDKNLKLLLSSNIKFVNNELAKVSEKKLINISPAELNNRFMIARTEIVNKILDELILKRGEIDDKIILINSYLGKSNDNIAISDIFKGELMQISENTSKLDSKKIYDM